MPAAIDYLAGVTGATPPKKRKPMLEAEGVDVEEIKRRAKAGEQIVKKGPLRRGSYLEETASKAADFVEGVVKGTAGIVSLISDVARMSTPSGAIRAATEGPFKDTTNTMDAIDRGSEVVREKAGIAGIQTGPAGVASEFLGEIVAPGPEIVSGIRQVAKVASKVDDVVKAVDAPATKVDDVVADAGAVPPEIAGVRTAEAPAPPHEPFSADTIEKTFQIPREQAVAAEAIADAMGLDKTKIRVTKGGDVAKDALMQSGDGRWYYDNVASSLDTWQGKGTPDQLLAHLKKSKGSMEEAETIGLTDWLKDKKSVTREDVQKFVDQNRIEIKEVSKGDRPITHLSDEEFDRLEDLDYRASGDPNLLDPAEKDEFLALIAKQNDDVWSVPTRYKDYQTPGGENYRELLLTLPPKKMENFATWSQRNGISADEMQTQWSERGPHYQMWQRESGPDAAALSYQSPHWEEPNVLAHVRMNDRVLPDGRKVLFLEEVQSDWHQAGRRKGYRAAGTKSDTPRGWGDTGGGSGAVPDAPFKGDGWKKLAMKRMLAYASENGYDGVAWTNGEMQAARYDLRKQVKEILHHKNDDGTYDVWVTGHDKSNILNEDDISLDRVEELVGKELASKIRDGEGIKQDGSQGYREWTTISGDGLAIGGEGMKGFYDRELPNIANDIAKKFGTRVERVDLPTKLSEFDSVIEVPDWTPVEVRRRAAASGDPRLTRRVITVADMMESSGDSVKQVLADVAADDEMLRLLDAKMVDNVRPQPIHFLPTPEQTRAAIKSNKLPLFQDSKAAIEFTEGGQAIIRALESPDVSSAVHEIAHVSRRFLFDRKAPADQRLGISDDDIRIAEEWAGAKDGQWNTAAEEKFARGFERYLFDGTAPNDRLAALFQKFKEWMSRIYTKLTGSEIDVAVSPEMRRVFDRLVSRGDQAPAGVASEFMSGVDNLPTKVPPAVDLTATRTVKTEPVKKVITALKEAKPLRKEQERIYTKTRSERMRDSVAAREGTSGEAGFQKELEALGGEMPKVQFESIRSKIGQDDVDDLFNMVRDAPDLSDFQKISARRGLAKLFGEYGGHVPQNAELKLLRKVFGDEFTEEVLAKRPMWEQFAEMGLKVANIPRALMSSLEMSAPLRQGAFFIGRPKQFFPAFKQMIRAFGSEDAYSAIEDSIRERPSFDFMQESGLSLTDLEDIASREEAFATSLAERMPVVDGSGPLRTPARLAAQGYNATLGKGVRASGRAYTAFLTKLRADVFDDMVGSAKRLGLDPEKDKHLAEAIAGLVNAGTGRGNFRTALTGGKPTAVGDAKGFLNAFFFSPKLIAARLTLLNPVYYIRQPAFVRKEALKSLASAMSVGATIAGLAKMAGADVEIDPRSSDFGKIRIGNTRLDPWAGFQQYVRMTAQLVTGEYKSATSGRMYELGDGFKARSQYDILLRQIESKEAPIPSFITEVLRQQDYRGEPVNVTKAAAERMFSMYWQDMYELYKEDPKLLPLGLPAFFGAGVQTFGNDNKRDRRAITSSEPAPVIPDDKPAASAYLNAQ